MTLIYENPWNELSPDSDIKIMNNMGDSDSESYDSDDSDRVSGISAR